MTTYSGQFLGLPPCALDQAEVVLVPVPLERTVSYGPGARSGPRAIIEASSQVETFDEETLVDFARGPRLHTHEPIEDDGQGDLEGYLHRVAQTLAGLRDRRVLALGGEHTVTYGTVLGLAPDPKRVTLVHVDAHADLIDRLEGRRWSHGTVMRRLWERGYRFLQIGIRSLSREEYELIERGERITTFFAHQLPQRWPELMVALAGLRGDVFLTFDIDGLDPSVVPSTGTPQPDGLTWRQAMEVLRALFGASGCRVVGADLVEFVASAHPPGCDLIAAKLAAKILAFWTAGSRRSVAPLQAGRPGVE